MTFFASRLYPVNESYTGCFANLYIHILCRLNSDLNSDSIYRTRLEAEEHSQVEVKYELKECIKVDYKAEWHIGFLLVCIVSIPMPMYTLLSNTSSKSLLKAFFTNPPHNVTLPATHRNYFWKFLFYLNLQF